MEFLRFAAPDDIPGSSPTVAVYEHKGHLIYVSLTIPEDEREAEAYRLLNTDIRQERTREARLNTLRDQVRNLLDLDADNPLGTADDTDVDAILLAIKWLFAEIKDLRSMNMKPPQESVPIRS